jgi:hypothetical protein
MKKIHQHRIVIRNFAPDDRNVSNAIEDELGDVEIVDWWIENQVHYQGLVMGGGMMPQRDSCVVVEYKKHRREVAQDENDMCP